MPELPLRNVPAHLVPGGEGRLDIGQVVVSRVIREIPKRHVGVKEFQGLSLLGGDDEVIHFVEFLEVAHPVQTGVEVPFHLVAVSAVGHKVAHLAGCEGEDRQDCQKGFSHVSVYYLRLKDRVSWTCPVTTLCTVIFNLLPSTFPSITVG